MLLRHARALIEARKFGEAAASFAALERLVAPAVDIDVDHAFALRELGRYAQAEALLRRAIALNPGDPGDPGDHWPRFHLAHLLLLLGRLTEAWPFFEARWDVGWRLGDGRMVSKRDTIPVGLSKRVWQGETLDQGQAGARGRLLIWQEEGLGDTIQFSRYVAMAATRAQVVLAVPAALARLLGAIEGVVELAGLDALPAHDAQISFLSLPRIFATAIDAIPRPGSYLTADAERARALRDGLETGQVINIGLVWAGEGRSHFPSALALDRRRSLPLAWFRPLACLPGVRLHSLQKGTPAAEIATAGVAIVDHASSLGDLADTAALIAALDLVISVDTAVAHLAGALGRDVWMLNRYDTNWRWFLGRADSPWYDRMRIFRQENRGDWDAVIALVVGAVQGRLARKAGLPSGVDDPRLALALPAHRAGRIGSAEVLYRTILDDAPDDPVALRLLGVVLGQRGDERGAEHFLRRAVDVAPGWFAQAHALGAFLVRAGRAEEALGLLATAIRLEPGLAEGHLHLAAAFMALGRMQEAIGRLRIGLRSSPDHAPIMRVLARLLAETGQYDEADHAYARLEALATAPDAGTMVDHAYVLKHLNQPARSERLLRDAIALDPGKARAKFNLGHLLALDGRLAEAWPLIEARWELELPRLDGTTLAKTADAPAGLSKRLWRGETDRDMRVLLWHEQGFGDTIQFSRYVRVVAARARVVVAAPAALARLLGAIEGVECVGGLDRLPIHDCHCPFPSLPLAFGTTLDTIPAPGAYLAPDPMRVLHWRAYLRDAGISSGLRVGLVWAGMARPELVDAMTTDRDRSLSPGAFKALGDIDGVHVVSLQVGDRAGEIGQAGFPILDPTSLLTDFHETAALIAALDLVISVDTAVAHLAGALGVPVWMLNRLDTDWRWLRDRTDSPWYGSMRIFRQTRRGDWSPVIEAAIRALRIEASLE